MRSIAKLHAAANEPIGDLTTYRALPTRSIKYIDPFLFLNHHGPQFYPPHNHGLPFGPHPHRGFETVTFVLDGDIYHKDSGGHSGTILSGGIQWMTAGSGLVHSEISSDHFLREGGQLEILQLWVNLPAKYKLVAPVYKDLQKEAIPVDRSADEKVSVNVISGQWRDTTGAYQPLSDISLQTIELEKGGRFTVEVPAERNVFFYVVRGSLIVNNEPVKALTLVEFKNEGTSIAVEATEKAYILFGHALPFNEPVVSHGPFVMNTVEEINQAFQDFQSGKMGFL